MKPTIIGTYTVNEGDTYSRGYEVAAWNTQIALTPGVYDVTANVVRSYVELAVKVPGVITSEYTPSLFGGVPINSQQPQGTEHRNVGQTTDCYLRVGIEQVALDANAGDHIAKVWVVGTRASEFSGTGLSVAAHTALIATQEAWTGDYRIDPNNGFLPEFVSNEHILCERVNELQAEGFDPDVWRVTRTDQRQPWFEVPMEDHRPYNARKFAHDYSNSHANWRYYLPNYDPRARVA